MGKSVLKVELVQHTPMPEEIVAMGAKLCYSSADITALKEGVNENDQSKFVEKLIGLGHLSPIEHASFTFGIEGVSRALLAQITRHRIASFSVKSQRYVGQMGFKSEDGVFSYIIPPRIMALGDDFVKKYEDQMKQMQEWYDFWNNALGSKGEESNEDARFVLPNAAETKMIVTMNARELLHFFDLRCCNRAQWEIRALAIEMLKLVKVVAPNIFGQAGPGCLMGPCPEGKMTCGKIAEVREMYSNLVTE